MNRKRLRKLQSAIEKRGGRFWMNPDTPPEITVAFLTELLDCPDCRPAVLEALGDATDPGIDAGIRALVLRGEH